VEGKEGKASIIELVSNGKWDSLRAKRNSIMDETRNVERGVNSYSADEPRKITSQKLCNCLIELSLLYLQM